MHNICFQIKSTDEFNIFDFDWFLKQRLAVYLFNLTLEHVHALSAEWQHADDEQVHVEEAPVVDG